MKKIVFLRAQRGPLTDGGRVLQRAGGSDEGASDLGRDAASGHRLDDFRMNPRLPRHTGASREDWPIEDPKGRSADEGRRIRDEVRRKVAQLVDAQGWSR